MTKRKGEEPARTEAQELDRLIQENEELRAENEDLRKKLAAAAEFLRPRYDELRKLLPVFEDAAIPEASPINGDPLLRFRPLLDNSGRESYRKVAQVIVEMGGHATVKQIATAANYSATTVENAIHWLKKHEVVRKDGKEAVIER